MSDSVRPHRWKPTRLPRPWDSPGKNTGVGCHFLLQFMKVKSEKEVTQLCPTLSDPVDYSLPGSSIHGIFQARVLEWGAIAFFETSPKWNKFQDNRFQNTCCIRNTEGSSSDGNQVSIVRNSNPQKEKEKKKSTQKRIMYSITKDKVIANFILSSLNSFKKKLVKQHVSNYIVEN